MVAWAKPNPSIIELGSRTDGRARNLSWEYSQWEYRITVPLLCQRLPGWQWEPMPRLLGDKLRHLRTQKHMTQLELAQRLGLARQGYVSNLEMGRKMPSLDLLVEIADLFGVTTDYLMRDSLPVEEQNSL